MKEKFLKEILKGFAVSLFVGGGFYLASFKASFHKGRADALQQIMEEKVERETEMIEEIAKEYPKAKVMYLEHLEKMRAYCENKRKGGEL